jgi:hypothetical protein
MTEDGLNRVTRIRRANKKPSVYERQNLRICVTSANPTKRAILKGLVMTLTCHHTPFRPHTLTVEQPPALPIRLPYAIFRITYIRAW